MKFYMHMNAYIYEGRHNKTRRQHICFAYKLSLVASSYSVLSGVMLHTTAIKTFKPTAVRK